MKFFADNLEYWTQNQVETLLFGNAEKHLALLISSIPESTGHYLEWNDQSQAAYNAIENISLTPQELQLQLLPDAVKSIGETAFSVSFECDATVFQEIAGRLKTIFGDKLQLKQDDKAAKPAPARDYSKVKYLDLAGKNLSELPPYVSEMLALERVRLDQNPNLNLEHALETLAALHSVKDLTFSAKNSLPANIGKLETLEKLSIDGIEAPIRLPDSIGQLQALQYLYIGSSSDLILPESFADLTALEDLHLRVPNWTPPSRFYRLTKLKQLDFSNCLATQIPPEISQMEALSTVIFASTSPIDLAQALPQVAKIPNLRSIELCVNALPAAISQCQQIEKLVLYFSGTKEQPLELPAELFDFPRLRVLTITGSYLRDLPPAIGRLTSLTELSFNETTFPVLPDTIGELQNLEFLNLSGNPALQNLPDSLGKLTKLKTLMLEELPHKPVLPEGLRGRVGLEILEG